MRALCFLLLTSMHLAANSGGFRVEQIAQDLGVVYAVTTADVNGDSKPDIVAINNTQLLWFENPSWTKHVVTEKVTEKDNVALAPLDVDNDGKLDFALGADWQSTNTASGGSLHWVSQAGEVHHLGTEPTIHRIRWADVSGDSRPELIVVPLHGRGTKAPDWTQGAGARILVYSVPKEPSTQTWPVEVADDSLHIVHNFITVGREIWAASAEGVHALRRGPDGKWSKRKLAEGRPGEIKLGTVNGKRVLATVEPWHANNIVVYEEGKPLWKRTVIDSELNQAHALGWADFDRDGTDELVAGWRGKPWGLAMYQFNDGSWKKTAIDDGVAVEDLATDDLNGDGRPEIIAGGRATGNLRIYWPAAMQTSASSGGADEAAIRNLVQRYMNARESRDDNAVRALFTADADQLVSSGEWRRGRDTLVKGAMASSDRGGKRTVTVESIRFITPGVAVADGRYEISGLESAATRKMWSTFVMTRTRDGWRIAAIRNMLPAVPAR